MMPFIDYHLTEREKNLVWQANQDLDLRSAGVFRINDRSFGCDACGSRIPHNGKHGDLNISDFDVVEDEILCRLCRQGKPDENQTGLIEPNPPGLAT